MSNRSKRMPGIVVELLRLCVVVFFAGLGYEVALLLESSGHREVLGGVDPLWVGLLLGTGLGFVLGGHRAHGQWAIADARWLRGNHRPIQPN